MAAAASRAPCVRERTSFAARMRRFITIIEPWYDWGKDATIWRLDQVERDFSDESVGDAYQIELQWFGLHLGFVIGRVPPKVSEDEVAARKEINRSRAEARAAEGADL